MSEDTLVVVTPHDEMLLVAPQFVRMRDQEAGALQLRVAAAAETTPGLPVVIDMSNVEYVPSRGIGTLVVILQNLKKEDRRLILAALQSPVRETLTVCRLDKFFEIFDTVDDALARIREPEEDVLE